MITTAALLTVPVAAVAALVASGVYYGAVGDVMVRLSPGVARDRSAGATVVVELTRNVVLALGAALLVAGLEPAGLGATALLAVGLWIAFPVILLTGSVFHERVPVALAALHAGDWLLKLVLVLGIVALLGT